MISFNNKYRNVFNARRKSVTGTFYTEGQFQLSRDVISMNCEQTIGTDGFVVFFGATNPYMTWGLMGRTEAGPPVDLIPKIGLPAVCVWMRVCMYVINVCMCFCMYVCMYACMYARNRARNACMYVSVYICIHTYIHAHTHTCTDVQYAGT
jgi:hypothetical protein